MTSRPSIYFSIQNLLPERKAQRLFNGSIQLFPILADGDALGAGTVDRLYNDRIFNFVDFVQGVLRHNRNMIFPAGVFEVVLGDHNLKLLHGRKAGVIQHLAYLAVCRDQCFCHTYQNRINVFLFDKGNKPVHVHAVHITGNIRKLFGIRHLVIIRDIGFDSHELRLFNQADRLRICANNQ